MTRQLAEFVDGKKQLKLVLSVIKQRLFVAVEYASENIDLQIDGNR